MSLVIAHRGASGYEYENSRAAFRAARARGADAIELDIHAAADGVLFVHHDEVVSGVHITRSSAAQVRALRLPNGESIPALEDALAVIDPALQVFIEVKSLPPEFDDRLFAELVDALHGAGYRIYAWTVNDPDEMRRLLALHVDGLCTNVPDVGRRAVDAGAA